MDEKTIADSGASRSSRDSDRGRKMRERRRAAGLCTRCNKPHDRDTNRCLACTKIAVAGNQRIKKQAREAGACAECRLPWSGLTLRCSDCLAKTNALWATRSFGGTNCTRCAKPRDDGGKTCSACREEQRVTTMRNRSRKDAACRCVQCGAVRSADAKGKYCETCILKTAARRWLGNGDRWQSLRALFEAQRGQCAYTGEPIAICGDASIDHILPRSRGGADDLSNLQWVSWRANRLKSDLTHEEFVAFCRRVVDVAERKHVA